MRGGDSHPQHSSILIRKQNTPANCPIITMTTSPFFFHLVKFITTKKKGRDTQAIRERIKIFVFNTSKLNIWWVAKKKKKKAQNVTEVRSNRIEILCHPFSKWMTWTQGYFPSCNQQIFIEYHSHTGHCSGYHGNIHEQNIITPVFMELIFHWTKIV